MSRRLDNSDTPSYDRSSVIESAILEDERRRNMRLVLDSRHRFWALTHPLKTARFINTNHTHTTNH